MFDVLVTLPFSHLTQPQIEFLDVLVFLEFGGGAV
jgi:hypothetical protein